MKHIIPILVILLLIVSAVSPMVIGDDSQLIDKVLSDNNEEQVTIFGDPPEVEWIKTYGGSGFEAVLGVQETYDSGYIFTGGTSSYGSDSGDVWLVKVDLNGNEEWNRTFGGTDLDYGLSVQQTSEGGYIIVGRTRSFGAGDYDVWLIKTDNNGNEQWNKTFGGANWDSGSSVQQVSNGGYIIAGSTRSFGVGSYDMWLIKTDADGTEEWNKTFGGDMRDEANSLQLTTDGGFILVGYTYSYGISCNAWLIKTDKNGNEQWNKTFERGEGYSGQQTTDGGYIITGFVEGFALEDIWLIKTDDKGNEQWNKTFGRDEDHDYGLSVQQTSDGGYVIAGYSLVCGTGEDNLRLIKTDENGSKILDKTFGGEQEDYGTMVLQTSDDGYLVAGWTESFGAGDFDGWLIKIVAFENQLPNPPNITGPTSGKPRRLYKYTFTAIDPDEDQLYYSIAWGDYTYEEWVGPYGSGEEVTKRHMWFKQGTYFIKAKVKDPYGAESDWGYLEVTMPMNQQTNSWWFLQSLQNHPWMFPILRYMLGL